MGSRLEGGQVTSLAPYAVALLAASSYLLLSAAGEGPGLPLDDGWIHQTYARNLAETGRLAFAPGTLSSGSTAPLWTALLAIGHLLRLPALLWAYLLGSLSHLLLIWAATRLWRVMWPSYARRDWVAGVALALSWPLVWAAGSGMETLLFMALGLALLAQYSGSAQSGWRLGLVAGLLILVRPDGLILVVLVLLALVLQAKWRRLGLTLAAALVLLLPYFAFNYAVSGVLWPNTFYAKQAEYAFLLQRPLPRRFLQLLTLSLGGPETGWRGVSGARLVLLPGLLLEGWRALRMDWARRRLRRTLPLLWAGGHVMAYALRLPVTYQHGRYLWAALPVWILFGLAGWGRILRQLQVRADAGRADAGHQDANRGVAGRVAAQSAVLVFAVLLVLFLAFGALAYAQDVAFVENEMVDVALWLRDHTAPEALIAAHDIGAIGYFARRPLLDLAGLISPDVIPYLADEDALAAYVRQRGAAYLVTAPGWPYPSLTSAADVRRLYNTGYAWTREQGLNNMAVYALPEGGAPSGAWLGAAVLWQE